MKEIASKAHDGDHDHNFDYDNDDDHGDLAENHDDNCLQTKERFS